MGGVRPEVKLAISDPGCGNVTMRSHRNSPHGLNRNPGSSIRDFLGISAKPDPAIGTPDFTGSDSPDRGFSGMGRIT